MPQYLIPFLPIIGIIIGAILTYLITSRIENRKWQQQLEAENRRWEKEKADLRLQRKREALEIILGWIEPISSTSLKARMLLERFIEDEITEQDFDSNYPDLKQVLQLLPPHLKSFLPEELYLRIDYLQMTIKTGKYIATLDKTSAQESKESVEKIRESIMKLEKAIQEEYMKTFQ